jgi:dTDP-glucose 4,6-dehydratase
MRVLVAGGAGFIGATMCRHLLDRGAEVVCVDNLVTGSLDNVQSLGASGRFTLVQADVVCDIDVGGPFDAVVNLACPASPVDFGPLALEILDVGSRGVSNLLDLAHRSRARYLQASTSEVYGDPLVHPQPETYWGNVNPIGVRSVYDEAKRFGEALTMAFSRRHGLEVRVGRIFNTYGPGMRPDDGRVISNFIVSALRGQPLTVCGDGLQTRSFCYVDDEVTGLLALLDSSYQGPVNIGNDDERTVLEVAQLVLELTRSRSTVEFVEERSDDPVRRRPDLTLAHRELGWKATTSLRDGLGQTIEWFASRVQP